MLLRYSGYALILGSLAVGTVLMAQPPPRRDDVAKKYGEVCASCHGPALQGAQAPSMLDDVWAVGNGDDATLAEVIKNGRVQNGMPAFGGMLTDQDIRAMVIFIREARARHQREGAKVAAPVANTVVQSEKHAFKLETVVEGVETPWGVAFLPDNRMLITEKDGQLRVVDNGRLIPEPVQGVPAVLAKGQGGLLDVAVHPDYANNGWIYLSYSDPGEGGSAMTVVVRAKLRDHTLHELQTLFKAPAATYRTGNAHFGSRFVFDGKGHVFFPIGDRGQQTDAQDLTKPNGKVHRIHDDGRVPADNPFVKQAGAIPTIWSYGHRNPQGLAQHPVTGALYDAEHGPRGGDELNLVERGKNYGWPVITYGMNYNGSPMTDKTAAPGMEQPVTYWVPSIAVSSIDFYTGSKFPAWTNHLFVGALAQQELRRLEVNGSTVTHQEVLFRNAGRVRDVQVGPDGYVYVVFNGPDRIARLVPATTPTSAAR